MSSSTVSHDRHPLGVDGDSLSTSSCPCCFDERRKCIKNESVAVQAVNERLLDVDSEGRIDENNVSFALSISRRVGSVDEEDELELTEVLVYTLLKQQRYLERETSRSVEAERPLLSP